MLTILKKNRALPVILLVALLVLMLPAWACAADIALTGVTVNDNTFPVTGDTVAVSEPFQAGDQPRFILNFSHNVATALDANLAELSMVKIMPDGEKPVGTSTFGGLTDMGLVIKPAAALENGSYKIIVAQGIQANAGTTPKAYEIFFNVGGQSSGGGSEQVSATAHKIIFDLTGMAADTKSIVTVKQNDQIFYPNTGSNFYLEAGEYTYAVSAPGYVTVTAGLTVSKDATLSIAMQDSVSITFSTKPSDASVRVKVGQNEFVNAYAKNVFKLTPGIEYTYIVEAPGYTTQAKRFTPVADEMKTIELLAGASAGSYAEQGNGGNTLTMLVPGASRITVKEDNLNYSYNVLTGSFDGSKEVSFGFTMGAGVNNFGDGAGFKANNMPQIAIYHSYKNGPQGSPMADYKSGKGNLKYIGFNAEAPEGKLITIGLAKGVLPDGTYTLVFGKNVCGNNVSKTLGKDIVFEFVVGQGVTGGAVTEPTTPAGPVTPVTKVSFADVADNSWYKAAVSFVVENGLFAGTSDKTFGPNVPMTRGMFVTVLGRLSKVEGNFAQTGISFKDVKPDAYYAKYVAWAAANGIVSGDGVGTFSPNRSITRQEAAGILFRYSKALGYDVTVSDNAAINKFSDASRVAPWAEEAMNWVLAKKVIGGNADGTLNPGGTATRAQVANIMMHFVNSVAK